MDNIMSNVRTVYARLTSNHRRRSRLDLLESRSNFYKHRTPAVYAWTSCTENPRKSAPPHTHVDERFHTIIIL